MKSVTTLFFLAVTLIISSCQKDHKPTSYFTVKDASDITEKMPVYYLGIEVGEVVSLELNKDYSVKVSFQLDSLNPLSEDTYAYITRGSGLLGSKRVVLSKGGGKQIPVGSKIKFESKDVKSDSEIGSNIVKGISLLFAGEQIRTLRVELDSLKGSLDSSQIDSISGKIEHLTEYLESKK